MKSVVFIIIGFGICFIVVGCCRYRKLPVETLKFDVGPDTYFEGPDWAPHNQKTIGVDKLKFNEIKTNKLPVNYWLNENLKPL